MVPNIFQQTSEYLNKTNCYSPSDLKGEYYTVIKVQNCATAVKKTFTGIKNHK